MAHSLRSRLPLRSAAVVRAAAVLAVLAACDGHGVSARSQEVSPSSSAAVSAGPMILGVQTHFSQGWPLSALDRAKTVHATWLRDSLPWKMAEVRAGAYDFSSNAARALSSACAAGHRLILTAVPQNPLYDGGLAVHSKEGQQAYAAYVEAMLDRWGDCVGAIEIGNEINTAGGLPYPEQMDLAQTYVALLKTLHGQVRPAHPQVKLLGGSSNMIATGFLENLFKAGMLPWVDGVAVHPYASHADSFDFELRHLSDVMARYAKGKEIWATEFSHDLKDRDLAAGEQLKAISLMASSHVDLAIWYALTDQKYFPRMGLFSDRGINPAGQSFTYAQEKLLTLAPPERVQMGDPLLFAFRYGPDRWLIWGNGQSVALPQGATVREPTGKIVPQTGALVITQNPLLIEGTGKLPVTKGPVLADTMLQYGTPAWQYFAATSDGEYHKLSIFDDRYTSYFGDRWYRPLRINMTSAAVAGGAKKPIRAVWRYVSDQDQSVRFAACLAKSEKGDGVDFRLLHNEQLLKNGVLTSRIAFSSEAIPMHKGGYLQFEAGPNQSSGGDSFAYRFIVAKAGGKVAAECP